MSPVHLARLESAMRVVTEFFTAAKIGDATRMARLMGDDCVVETGGPAPGGARLTGPEAAADYLEALTAGSDPGCIELEEAFGFSNRCVVRWRRGGADPTRGVDLFTVRDGSIREILSYVKA